MALLLVWIVIGLRRRRFAQLSLLAATTAVAILANAVVCGALANPHNRYGARLVWFAPLIALMVPLALAFPGTALEPELRDALERREGSARA